MKFQIKQWITRHRRLLLVALFLVALLAAAQLLGLRSHLTLDYLRQTLEEHQGSGIAFFALLFVLGNLIQIPGWIFLAAAVLVFGRLAGGLATYLAASVSCITTFLLVRWLGGNAMQDIPNKYAQSLLAKLHQRPIANVVILRTLFQTLPALNFALAMSGIGFKRYVVGTFLGLPLPIAAYCVFFDYLFHLKVT